MRDGFFTRKETESKSRPDGRPYSCASCGLYVDVKSPRMPIYGKGKKGILIIGEAPGETEDRRGHPWQGKAGRLLQHTLIGMDIDIFEDCACINAVNCRPPDNRAPKQYEIDCCRITMLDKVIKDFEPKVILLLGSAAIQSIIGSRWKQDLGGVSKWRGWEIPDQDYGCWLLPTYHPSFVHRQLDSAEVMTVWKEDLKKALMLSNTTFRKFREPNIQYLENISVLTRKRRDITHIAFDYETTGIKPQRSGHRVICAAMTTNMNETYAFLTPPTRQELKPFLELLTDNSIYKMAHNIKYEDTWTQYRFRTKVNNWLWDSMLAAHLLDNRPGVTGLKFQTYVNFGVVDYASDMAPYLRTTENSGNAINKLPEFVKTESGKHMTLKYCGWDSYCQYLLAMKQMEILNYDKERLPF